MGSTSIETISSTGVASSTDPTLTLNTSFQKMSIGHSSPVSPIYDATPTVPDRRASASPVHRPSMVPTDDDIAEKLHQLVVGTIISLACFGDLSLEEASYLGLNIDICFPGGVSLDCNTMLSLPALTSACDMFAALLDSVLLPAARLIRDDHDMEIIAEEVLSHSRIEDDPDDVLKMLVRMVEDLDLSGDNQMLDRGYVCLSLAYHLGKLSLANTYRRLSELDGLTLLKPIIIRCGDHRIHRPAVKLLFELCLVEEFSLSELSEIDEALVLAVLDQVERTDVDDASENELNSLVTLMLAFNHQFCLKNHARTVIPNQVMKLLSSRMHLGKKLGETIILIFNRAENPTIQRLTLRFLKKLFSTSETAGFFYTNDINVIMDVVLRESRSIAEEDEEVS
ncbi:hypothetical protein HDU96_005880 [Phlyctochytrium bullatum]|nr:hypothetical protein HDU96_005880 [Phlyctochytrium bullatum]